MTSAQSALVNEELVGALNALRMKHVDRRGLVLEQVRFRSRRLRSSPEDHLALQAMISVFDGAEEVARSSANAVANIPDAFDGRMNVLRSLSALHMKEEATTLAQAVFRDCPTWKVLAIATACLCNVGALAAAHELVSPWAEKSEGYRLDESELQAVQLHRMLDALKRNNVGDQPFSQFLSSCRAFLAKAGWPTAGLEIVPVNSDDVGFPAVLVEFFIDAEGDCGRVMEVEDGLMQELMSDELFSQFKVAVAVSPTPVDEV